MGPAAYRHNVVAVSMQSLIANFRPSDFFHSTALNRPWFPNGMTDEWADRQKSVNKRLLVTGSGIFRIVFSCLMDSLLMTVKMNNFEWWEFIRSLVVSISWLWIRRIPCTCKSHFMLIHQTTIKWWLFFVFHMGLRLRAILARMHCYKLRQFLTLIFTFYTDLQKNGKGLWNDNT